MKGGSWSRNLVAGTAKILGLVVVVATAGVLLVLYFVLLDWAIDRYGSTGPDETTWEDYGAVAYLWIPPALLGGAVAGCLWWVLDEWRYFRDWTRSRAQQVGIFVGTGAVAAVLVYVLFLGFST
jgi:hypothetical protein